MVFWTALKEGQKAHAFHGWEDVSLCKRATLNGPSPNLYGENCKVCEQTAHEYMWERMTNMDMPYERVEHVIVKHQLPIEPNELARAFCTNGPHPSVLEQLVDVSVPAEVIINELRGVDAQVLKSDPRFNEPEPAPQSNRWMYS